MSARRPARDRCLSYVEWWLPEDAEAPLAVRQAVVALASARAPALKIDARLSDQDAFER